MKKDIIPLKDPNEFIITLMDMLGDNFDGETVYITDDGQTFNDRHVAKKHEQEFYTEELRKSPDVIIKENGLFPYESWMDEDENTYIWCKALNQKGLDLLNKAYCDPYALSPKVGQWVCFEISGEDIYMYTLEATLESFKKLAESLGFNISVS